MLRNGRQRGKKLEIRMASWRYAISAAIEKHLITQSSGVNKGHEFILRYGKQRGGKSKSVEDNKERLSAIFTAI